MKYLKTSLLILIFSLAIVLRFYRLGTVPPAISWDEAAVGYNAWTILNWGRDEWGIKFPLVFKSFEDYKNPIHIYASVPFIKLFGLNEFGVRASSATFGVLNVIIIYFLAKKIFKNLPAQAGDWVGIIASFILAISPYNLQFSRFNHELNFALFFFMAGLFLFLEGMERKNYFIPLAFLFFGLDLFTYQSAKVVLPAILLALIVLYFKNLWKNMNLFVTGLIIFSIFVATILKTPELLGTARLKQTIFGENEIEKTDIFIKTHNLNLGRLELTLSKYAMYFKPDFLFVSGDPNARFSIQSVGTFYKMDAPFLVIGLLVLLYGILFKRKKEYLILIIWALVAPIPGTLGGENQHSARAMFIAGSWHLIMALGVVSTLMLIKNKIARVALTICILVIFGKTTVKYLTNYYEIYPKRYAIEWQYGMKEIVDYVIKHPRYERVYMTDAFSQPYIFFLFYTKTPLWEFLSTSRYNTTKSRPSNLVASFGKYNFGLWNEIESAPDSGVLYIVNPSKYSGLMYRQYFELVSKVDYPNNTDAFFLVAAP